MEQNLHQTQTVTVIALIIFALIMIAFQVQERLKKQWTDFVMAEKSVHG